MMPVMQSLIVVAVAALLALPGAATAETVPQSREEIQLTFAPLVRKVAPAVVNIYATKIARARRAPSLFDDPFFRRFFGDRFGFNFDVPRERVRNSLGSGVIVRADGVIVTNNHVIEGASEIIVVLADRRQFAASIVGTDEKTDLAVLRVDTGDTALPYLELRDSDDVEVGDLVLAIGNPFGVGQTVTSGIVSAVARTQVGISDYNFFIQTDAAINPGNSGGALVTVDGKLIGVNTAIFSRTGGSHGIGFAIPSNMVRAVLAGFATGAGRLVRPWLGAWGTAVTADMAATLGLARPAGIVIESVYPGSAAARADLQAGDVVLAINGREVEDAGAMRYRIATLGVGGTATLAIWRRGKTLNLTVALEPPREDPPRDTTELGGAQPLSGTTVANMSPALAEELGVDRFQPGVVVIRLRRGTVADRLGFRPGDRVIEVNGEKIASVRALKGVLARDADQWRIAIDRSGKVLSLVVNR
jgi:serine protease Do